MAKNSFVDCSMEEFSCPAIKKEGVRHINMTFLETTIPPTDTNYYCMTFDLPTDQDYHVIANEPIIDNADVLHHILVYACEEENATAIPVPRSCGMEAESHCGSIIGLWTVGSPGFCFGENAGFRFGKSAFKRVKLEIHYNNPMMRSGMTDKSGIRLYFQPATPDLEDMVTLTLGTNLFEIPPGKPRYEVKSVCKGSCTSAMVREPAKIYAALNHMHYMGTAMMIELFRNGQKIADITNEGVYNYDSPKLFTHSPALDLQKGDEIKTTCVYNSMGSDRSVFYGEATSDEMCYGFVFAYPKNAFEFDNCMSFDELDICDLYTGKPVETPRGDCYWGAFTHFDKNYQPPWTEEVKEYCQMDGFCRPECRRTVERLMEDPCMDKAASLIVNWRLADSDMGRSALARMNGCRGAIYHSEDSHGGDDSCGWDECSMYCEEHKGGHGPYSDAPKMAAGSITVIVAALLLQYLSA
ncbi:dopamine beta-hydroxylase [Plakobranchus ocellatus]|uniref:Dopamine beta-hydroxylase n=1 Tax=Plakobranchus ocellatus TaxID=259542 RepID=A0AAV3YAY7_9GAST|nr:dopamine beta-hydroxylase [Plakobranchus ocellatus]